MIGNLMPKCEVDIRIGTKTIYPHPHAVLYVKGIIAIFVSDTKLSCPIGIPIGGVGRVEIW